MSRTKVLFVCLGNICRSPTAEGVFRALVEKRGLAEAFEIDSVGTSGWHQGEAPDPRSQAEAHRHGIDISGQRGRGVVPQDFERFDYILAMDKANLTELKKRCPREFQGRLHLFTDFAPTLALDGVPDPYYGGPRGFEEVFKIVTASAAGLLKAIEQDCGLEAG